MIWTNWYVDKVSALDPAFDMLEAALNKFHDGPFFLGQFSLVSTSLTPPVTCHMFLKNQ